MRSDYPAALRVYSRVDAAVGTRDAIITVAAALIAEASKVDSAQAAQQIEQAIAQTNQYWESLGVIGILDHTSQQDFWRNDAVRPWMEDLLAQLPEVPNLNTARYMLTQLPLRMLSQYIVRALLAKYGILGCHGWVQVAEGLIPGGRPVLAELLVCHLETAPLSEIRAFLNLDGTNAFDHTLDDLVGGSQWPEVIGMCRYRLGDPNAELNRVHIMTSPQEVLSAS